MTSDEVRRRMAELPEPATDKQPPFWEFWRWQLWRLAQTEDVGKFEQWPCVYHTMLVNHWPKSIEYEFEHLTNSLRGYCFIPETGPSDKLGNTNYSMNLIHQAYHIWQWEQLTDRRIHKLDTIVEFGGGYGAMALLCYRLGFKGRYVIYDLPEFSLLQEWYLSQFGIEAEWNPKRWPKNIDLYIALYSQSEVYPESRGIPTRAKSYLFLYSGKWEEYDNVSYFQVFMPSISEIVQNWRHTELKHLPDPQNFYSIGW